jgi:hypothetical protein
LESRQLDYCCPYGGTRIFHRWCHHPHNSTAQYHGVKMEIINWKIVSHPMNWAVLFLMVLIFGFALHLILDFYGVKSNDSDKG